MQVSSDNAVTENVTNYCVDLNLQDYQSFSCMNYLQHCASGGFSLANAYSSPPSSDGIIVRNCNL